MTAACSKPIFANERYLPFEGFGAISEWRLELPGDPRKDDPRQFDYDSDMNAFARGDDTVAEAPGSSGAGTRKLR